MDIRQSVSDLILKLKEDRKTQVIAIIAVFCVIFLALGEKPQRRFKPSEDIVVDAGATSEKEKSGELMTAFGNQLNNAKKQQEATEKRIQDLTDKMSENEEQTAAIMKRLIEKISDLDNALLNAQATKDGPINATAEDVEATEEDGLTSFGQLEEEEVKIPEEEKPERLAVIGAADSVRVKLLTGVHARTDGVPYPVVMEFVDDIIGPDGTTLPLGNARLVAAAQGSLTDQRALFRLHTLNINLPNGARKIVNVDGWVVGEDGLAGLEGILIDPIGRVIAGNMMAGTLQGLGEGVADSQMDTSSNWYGVTKVVSGDTWKYALGRGVEKGADSWADFIKERADSLVPHIRILSGRTCTAVFSKSVTIKGLYEALSDGNDEGSFVSLD